MKTETRTDAHRPSVIEPEEYALVTYSYRGSDPFVEMEYAGWQREFSDHLKSTGGRLNGSRSGGCSICGAHFAWGAIFYHERTNEYIHVGHICAEKMDILDGSEFRSWQERVKSGALIRAGKAKAREQLEAVELGRAWAIHELDWKDVDERNRKRYEIIRDIVSKLVRYGSISDKQEAFLRKLVGEFDAPKQERETGEHVGTVGKRSTFDVELVAITGWETAYGYTTLYVMKDSDGNTIVWKTGTGVLAVGDSEYRGTVYARKGDRFQIKATVKEHAMYHGTAQTIVSRVMVTDVHTLSIDRSA